MAICLSSLGTLWADVRLPAVISSHMVLQRGQDLSLWGWADVGEKVAVMFAGQTHQTVANEKGKWEITLTPLKANSEPAEMVVEGKNRLVFTDILVGEVWVCSGQSNMEWPVSKSLNGDLAVSKANHPQIRLLTVNTPGSHQKLTDFGGRWQVCTPDSIAPFSAVGYFFGLELHEQLNVPIGLIDNAWGGSPAQSWIQRERFVGNPGYDKILAQWKKKELENNAKEQDAKFDADFSAWEKKRDRARAAGEPGPELSIRRNRTLNGKDRPGNLYNGRNGPILGYGVKGVIWYQGESDASRAKLYYEMFPLMIQTWRDGWKNPEMSFYWVQLADFKSEDPKYKSASDWAELRDAQTATLDRLSHTGQAVIIDLGEASDIHPRNKIEVGLRLARLALAKDYGHSQLAHLSPRFDSLKIKENKAIVTMKDVGKGLRAVDTRSLHGFMIAGEDKVWRVAKAKIISKTEIALSAQGLQKPVAVRYGWANNPVCNLYNQAGLPATPFRSDNW